MLTLGWVLLVIGTGGFIANYVQPTLKAINLRILFMVIAIIGAVNLTAIGVPIIER